MRPRSPVILTALPAVVALAGPAAAAPEWIWTAAQGRASGGEVVFFRKVFTLAQEVEKVEKAVLVATCDNEATVHLNGEVVARTDDWTRPVTVDVKTHVRAGANVFAVRGRNDGSDTAGLYLRLRLLFAGGAKEEIGTDASWRLLGEAASGAPDGWIGAGFDDRSWGKPVLLGELGAAPWRLEPGGRSAPEKATPGDSLALLPGFEAEVIYTVPRASEGSWVALASDPRGRLIASDQGEAGLYRITPPPLPREGGEGGAAAGGGARELAKVERIEVPLSGAQGLAWAIESLWVHVNGGGGGLYRVRDSDGDDRLDEVEKLYAAPGGGEHGQHAVIAGADGESLYVVAGNHTDLPVVAGSRFTAPWGEDHLLPRQWDALGHARGRLAPGGWVAKVTERGARWEVFSIGYRNAYDIALNRDGELFTFDADMEWDMGMPWYRPTRVCHVVSGSDYGWRSGSGKWPTYYEDSLPPVIDIGPGSPTGVVFGTGAAFPPEYQDALYILDWTFGTIHAVHLRPRGASYTGVKEDFVSGSPLPVSDAVVAADGAFYFTVGGRGTQSALYRITFRGREAPPPAAGAGDGGAEAQDRGAEAGSARAGGAEAALEAAQRRTERRSLERFHGREDPAAVDEAWPFLAHEDRFLRHAARLAIESQPVAVWKERALAETRPRARVAAAVALARAGGSEVQGELLDALRTWDPAALEEGELLGLLRAYALSFIRQGRPSRVQADAIVAQLDPYLPSPSDAVSSELVQVLVYLNAPGIVEKTLRLVADERPEAAPDWAGIIDRNPGYGGAVRRLLEDHPPSRRIGYAFHLRNVRYGWSLSEREAFFRFINEASKHPGGASYAGFLKNLRADALANCSPAERSALASITGESLEPPPPFAVEPLSGAGRVWTVPLALGEVEGGLSGRSFEGGRNVFHAASCAKCHRFDGAGGAIGPDLSSVRSRFSHADLLEAVIEPSKVISDQYRSSLVVTKDGRTLVGLVVETAESDGPRVLEVHTADVDKPPVRVEASEVARREPSPLSQMPEGLANALSRDELLDLVAYLMSRGDPSDRVFEAPE